MALPIGTILDGKFKIVQVVGEGGMGTVYKVELVGKPGYYRAVKELLINPNTSELERKTAIERFEKEIDLLFNLKHPHIAAFMYSFRERGNYYYVMEYVPGQSLDKLLEKNNRPLNEDDVLRWMIQVCEALSYIHSQNPPIILRDLKPGNIMVTPSGDIQLIDFGIARRFNPNKRTNTENLGTISYASPEHLGSITAPGQKRSAQNPGTKVQTDARSDIYSLGATMYHLLTNYEPDPIQTPPVGSILARNPRLRTVRVGNTTVCPVEQIIIKAMQQNPAMRFQNAEAMRTALQQCLPNNGAGIASTTIQIPAMNPNATIIVPARGSSNGNNSGLICPKCGFQNRPGAKFCKRDGQPLVQGATTVPPQIRAGARMSAPIQARPVAQPIRARPVSVNAPPADPMAAYRLGLQNFNNKNYAQAIQQFKLAQAIGKPSFDTLYNLGRAYRQNAQSYKGKDEKQYQDQMKMAAEQFDAATRLKPDTFNAYFQLGMCYREMALYPQAATTFKTALRLLPGDTGTLYQLGLVAMEQKYFREAEGYFLEGLKSNPDHALILIALGRLYLATDQTKSAISTLRKATQTESALPMGWYELGRAHMQGKQWKLALSALEQARQRDSAVGDIYSAMATCYLRMNKKNEAREKVREALQLDPQNAEAQRVQKQL